MSPIATPARGSAAGATAEVYAQMMQAAGHVPHPFATITSSAISDEECSAITAAGSTD